MTGPLREAASVILLRRAAPGFEVFLLRRRKGATFMASTFVFPGGGTEPGEDAATCALRELFEEAGVLLAHYADEHTDTLEGGILASTEVLRRRVLDGGVAADVLSAVGLAWATEELTPWAHWVTPSVEPRRFSARFFVCELPQGQEPSFDAVETVDQVWVRPGDAIARAGELALPPPQLRTMWELAEHATIGEVIAAGKLRDRERHPIMPQFRAGGGDPRPCLLLPWDPEYGQGTGEAAPFATVPAWARGPSRFVLEDRTWKHIDAPGSTTVG